MRVLLAAFLLANVALAEDDAPPPIVPPRVITPVAPIYPPDAYDEGVQGAVTLVIDVGITGHVEYARVTSSPDKRLTWALLGAVTQMRFAPATQGGEPIRVRLTYGTRFEIEEKEEVREVNKEEALARRVVNFRGHVEVAAELLSLEGALVSVEGHAASAFTDEEGYFELRGVPEGDHEVTVEMAGFKPYVVQESFAPNVVTSVRYFVRRDLTSRFETTVRARREQREVNKTVLTQKELTRVPGTFGDAIRVVQRLPGVARAPFGLGAVVVRGANPDDSAVHIDGHLSRVLFHLGAGPSVINTDLVEKLEFQPGGFGVRYGRATAGVVEVITRDPNFETWSGKVQVDLLQTNFRLEGPLLGGAVFFAGRRSYVAEVLNVSDLVQTFVDPDAVNFTLAPRYYDYQAKAAWKLGHGHKVSVSLFGSDDVLNLAIDAVESSPLVPERIGSTTGFHRLNPRWDYTSLARHDDGTPVFKAFLSPMIEATYSENRFDESLFRLDIQRAALRGEAEWAPSPQLRLLVGADLFVGRFQNSTDIPFILPDERLFPRPVTSDATRYQVASVVEATANAFYSELIWQPGPLTVVAGLRADTWTFYDQLRTAIDPRINFKYKIFDDMAIKGAVGLYHKAPNPFELAEGVGNPELPLEFAWQYDVGFEATLTRSLNIDWHAFYRTNNDLAVFEASPLAFRTSDRAPVQPNGRGRAYGMEMLLRQHLDGGLFGWIAYTLLRSENIEDIDPDNPEQTRWHLSPSDQTHILSIALSYQLPWELEIGGALRYVTGNPQTFAAGGVLDTDTSRYRRVNGAFRGQRLPPFFQIDLRVDKRFTFDHWALALFLDLQNATNQTNFEFFQYNYDFSEVQGFPGLPIIPVFGLEASF